MPRTSFVVEPELDTTRKRLEINNKSACHKRRGSEKCVGVDLYSLPRSGLRLS